MGLGFPYLKPLMINVSMIYSEIVVVVDVLVCAHLKLLIKFINRYDKLFLCYMFEIDLLLNGIHRKMNLTQNLFYFLV